jgi:hypothetical protein
LQGITSPSFRRVLMTLPQRAFHEVSRAAQESLLTMASCDCISPSDRDESNNRSLAAHSVRTSAPLVPCPSAEEPKTYTHTQTHTHSHTHSQRERERERASERESESERDRP